MLAMTISQLNQRICKILSYNFRILCSYHRYTGEKISALIEEQSVFLSHILKKKTVSKKHYLRCPPFSLEFFLMFGSIMQIP